MDEVVSSNLFTAGGRCEAISVRIEVQVTMEQVSFGSLLSVTTPIEFYINFCIIQG